MSTVAEYREKIERMVSKQPLPEKIASFNSSRDFKKAYSEAIKAKSLEKLQTAYNQLRSFYGQ